LNLELILGINRPAVAQAGNSGRQKRILSCRLNYNSLYALKPATVALLAGNDLSHTSFSNYFVSVDEGHFGNNGEFVADRRRNGDSVRGGIWVSVNDGVIRIIASD